MTKVVKIRLNYHAVGPSGISYVEWEGGKFYPLTPESQRQVDLENGDIVDAPEDYEKALAAAEAARAAADKAEAKAVVAEENAAAAEAATAPTEAAQ